MMQVVEIFFQSALALSSLVNLYEMPKNHTHFTHQVAQIEMKFNAINNKQTNSNATIADCKKQMTNLAKVAQDIKSRIEEDLKKLNKLGEVGFPFVYTAIAGNYKYKHNENYTTDATIATISGMILAYQFFCAKKLENLLARLETLVTKINISVATAE